MILVISARCAKCSREFFHERSDDAVIDMQRALDARTRARAHRATCRGMIVPVHEIVGLPTKTTA